ncbi:MAG: lysine--tRNA ligase [Candidatus Eremiobacteraeota bacterium]|nr:lysine--tRNA ligase [Candidatus Eremiobacteraeota bacterium]
MTQEPPVGAAEAELIKARRGKLDALRAFGQDPFQPTSFSRTHDVASMRAQFAQAQSAVAAPHPARLAGRLGPLRRMGKKSVFADVADQTGAVQLYLRPDDLGEGYAVVDMLDRGDIVGVEGEPFVTKTGELTLRVRRLEVLAKALRPLPEKWHGLSDTETRYRKRYVDMIINRPVLETMLLRSRIVSAVRRYLDDRGFVEVETPVLVTLAGGASARPFLTRSNALDIALQLRIATELNLKRCIVGGMEKVYELGRIFRNEGVDTRHNPEFTMLELYEAYSDLEGMMQLSEDLVTHLAELVAAGGRHGADGVVPIDYRRPFRRIAFLDAMRNWGGLERAEVLDESAARAAARRLGVAIDAGSSHGHLIDKLFESLVEPQLADPTFITDYPVVLSPLAKRKRGDPELVERFELFIDRMEAANAFSELNDPDDQRARFMAQSAQRYAGDADAPEPDWDFVAALEYGMPPTGGIGIGIDRLVMLLAGERSVRDVLLFPLQKPL